MCDESAIAGKITDESDSKSFERNSKILMIIKGCNEPNKISIYKGKKTYNHI